jgi:hypothetical protein
MKEKLYAGALVLAILYLITEQPSMVITALVLCFAAMFVEQA